MLDEIEVREHLAKRMKRSNTILSLMCTGLIKSAVITGMVSITAFASGVGQTVRNALTGASLIFSLVTAIAQKSFNLLTVKQ